MRNPHHVTVEFEQAIAEYTGAPHVVAVSSCTMALLLAVKWNLLHGVLRGQINTNVEIPSRTYISVPMSIIHAGGWPTFRDETWMGAYELKPIKVWDSARHFTEGMYGPTPVHGPNSMICVSFHASKTLGIEQGGAILHDNKEADAWLRRMRFDGRTEGVAPNKDNFREIGYHCYMSPSVAAQGLLKLHSLPRHNAPLPNDDYPDLSQMDIFK